VRLPPVARTRPCCCGNVTTRKKVTTLVGPGPYNVTSMAFSPDGRTLATVNDDGSIRLWDTTARTSTALTGHQYFRAITSVAFSPHGKTVASGSQDMTVRVWTVRSA
jgi:WD40 repeat protein